MVAFRRLTGDKHWSGLLVAGLVLIAGLGAWNGPLQGPADQGGELAWFADVTSDADLQTYRGQTFGAAWGDANGDGLPDLWASGHSPQRLFVNQGDGRFVDRTREMVAPIRYSDRHNAAWADIDNDGDEDLIQLSGAGRGHAEDPNALYLNNGGLLQDRAAEFRVAAGQIRARAPLWVDLDGDRRLDLIMTAAARIDAPPSLFRWRRDAQRFDQQPLGFLQASEIARLGQLGQSGALHVITGLPHELLVHEVRDGNLIDVGNALGLSERPGHSVFDLLIADLDNDLAMDIVYVRGFAAAGLDQPAADRIEARLRADRGRNARISFRGPQQIRIQPYPRGQHWWSRGRLFIGAEGRPPDAMPVELRADDPAVIGLADVGAGLFAGFDPDGDRWLLELRAIHWDSVNLELTADGPIRGLEADGFDAALRQLTQSVQWNTGKGFSSAEPIAHAEGNCMAGAAADFDNDMDVDLYFVCTDYLHNRSNLLLENLGQRRFRPVPQAGGAAGSAEGLGESVAVADYDIDGFLDLFVRNGHELPPFADGPDQLFHNLGNDNHWIQIDLVGIASNRNGIGSRVAVTAGGIQQVRIVDNGTHGRVQDFRRLHYGLGQHEVADRVRVAWPSGTVTTYRQLLGDRVWRLHEDGAAAELEVPAGFNARRSSVQAD